MLQGIWRNTVMRFQIRPHMSHTCSSTVARRVKKKRLINLTWHNNNNNYKLTFKRITKSLPNLTPKPERNERVWMTHILPRVYQGMTGAICGMTGIARLEYLGRRLRLIAYTNPAVESFLIADLIRIRQISHYPCEFISYSCGEILTV